MNTDKNETKRRDAKNAERCKTFLECGGKRSATPLWEPVKRLEMSGWLVFVRKRCRRFALPPQSRRFAKGHGICENAHALNKSAGLSVQGKNLPRLKTSTARPRDQLRSR